ncbi:MAG: proteasome-type protease [Ilumatobacteraceae bacterium]
MTFCIGVRVADGLIALSDTRIVRGEQISQKAKLSMLGGDVGGAFVMTSGLRSVRDKVVRRLEDEISAGHVQTDRMHQMATAFGDQLRVVRAEDGEALADGGLTFNAHAILGGQLVADGDPMLLHVYPEGNWVEATPDAPYFIVGRSYYGKPILDRLLDYATPLPDALALAYLAFDATRASANDVDFPIDVAVLRRGEHRFTQHRFAATELESVATSWNDHLGAALAELPKGWTEPLLARPSSPESPDSPPATEQP